MNTNTFVQNDMIYREFIVEVLFLMKYKIQLSIVYHFRVLLVSFDLNIHLHLSTNKRDLYWMNDNKKDW